MQSDNWTCKWNSQFWTGMSLDALVDFFDFRSAADILCHWCNMTEVINGHGGHAARVSPVLDVILTIVDCWYFTSGIILTVRRHVLCDMACPDCEVWYVNIQALSSLNCRTLVSCGMKMIVSMLVVSDWQSV